MQFLLGEAGSVEYFAVTATDFAYKLRTPYAYEYKDDGEPGRLLVLNETPVGAVDQGTMFGGFEASYLNFGFKWGGSHADNWRYFAAGVHSHGVRTSRLTATSEDLGNQGDANTAVNDLERPPPSLPLPTIDWEAEEAKDQRECAAELGSGLSANGDAESVRRRWVDVACDVRRVIPESEQERIRMSAAWQRFRASGTLNTFATTGSHLFDKYPAEVFYALWVLGPDEGSLQTR